MNTAEINAAWMNNRLLIFTSTTLFPIALAPVV